MPQARQRPSKAALARLSRLPRDPALILEGGRRPMGVYYWRNASEPVQEELILWLDAQSGYVRGTRVIPPPKSSTEAATEALVTLVESVNNPMMTPSERPAGGDEGGLPLRLSAPHAALPAEIRIDDADLAEAIRPVFTPLGVTVSIVPELPAFDAAFTDVATAMGGTPGAAAPEPFTWEIDPALLPPLFGGAARYARRAPWVYMPDHPPIGITLGADGPEDGVETLYGAILGGGGYVIGVAFYYSLDEFREARDSEPEGEQAVDDEEVELAIEMLRQADAPIQGLSANDLHDLVVGFLATATGPDDTVEVAEAAPPPEQRSNCLVFFLNTRAESDPTYLRWLEERQIGIPRQKNIPSFLRTSPDSPLRPPNAREVRAMTLALAALDLFFARFATQLATPIVVMNRLSLTVRLPSDLASGPIELHFPPLGYDWQEDVIFIDSADLPDNDAIVLDVDDTPPPPPDPTAQRTLYRFTVKRGRRSATIDLRGDQTLHSLHDAIQQAFGLDDDHLYAFFLSGEPWDEDSEYASPFAEGRSADRYNLVSLPLVAKQQLLYIFDFGDELIFKITLQAIEPDGVEAGTAYPRIMP